MASSTQHIGVVTLVAAVVFLAAGSAAQAGDAPAVTLKKLDGKIRVEVGGELFTEYVYKGYEKPICYPVMGPGQVRMNRNSPMKKTPGEANDHPHHKSLWFTHGDVNKVDFWAVGKGKGLIVQDKLVKAEVEGGKGVIEAENKWVGPDKRVVLTESRTLVFWADEQARGIDWHVTLHASQGPVTLGDTKEGSMGIRTHPSLRVTADKRRGVAEVTGKGVNSEGVKDKAMWGKHAKWVAYWGKVDGKPVGFAIFDHPGNPRYPTTWHARTYGLVTANPFGLHYFERKPRGTGDMKIEAGKSVTFHYRFVFYPGDYKQGKVAERFETWAKTKQE